MATLQTITGDNYSALLARSTQPRSGIPDGNVYVDLTVTPPVVQLITFEELSQIDLGSGLEDNPLGNETKIDNLALYFFILDRADSDADLQDFARNLDAVPNRMGRLVGATSYLNGVSLDSSDASLAEERNKISNSGVTEFDDSGAGNDVINRVYHGARSSGLDVAAQGFYQIVASLSEADRMAVPPVNFSKLGDINELVQTFGTTANGDAGAGDFDARGQFLIVGARQFGFTMAEADSPSAGVAELGAYSQPYNLVQTSVPEIAALDPNDVYGGSAITPYQEIDFTRRDTPLVVPGFTQGSGSFTDVIGNTAGASLLQLRAWADMAMQDDSDINTNTGSTGAFIPKRVEPLYTINAQGKVAWRQGIYVEVPVADRQNVVYTDDIGTELTWPFQSGVEISLSGQWFDDSGQWFRVLYVDGAGGDDFNTINAVTLNDADGTPVFGDKNDARITPDGDKYKLSFSYDYDSDTDAGLPAGVDKDVVVQVGGINSKRATVAFTITRAASILVNAETETETNR